MAPTVVAVADADRSGGGGGCAVPVQSGRGPTYVPSSRPGSPCGTPAHPWTVDAEPGQRLDVAVTDFASADPADDPDHPGIISRDKLF